MGSNRFLKLALMALLALAPMQTGAALAAPKAVNPVDIEREAATLLADIVAWAGSGTRLMARNADVLTEIIDIVAEASEPDGPDSEVKIADRLEAVDRQLINLKADAAALPAFPADIEARILTLGTDAAPQIAAFKAMPGQARALIGETEKYLESVRPFLLPAAAGEEESQISLSQRTMLGMAVMLKSENGLLDLAMNTIAPPSHPQLALAGTIKASNEAMIILIEFAGQLPSGSEAADPVAAGKAMQGRLAEARAQALLIEPRAAKISSELAAELPEGPFKVSLMAAMATYSESAQIEFQILDRMDLLAASLVRGEVFWQSDARSFPGIGGLIERRLELQRERVARFSRN